MNNKFRKFDEPVSMPESDLLGAVIYAKNLAKFIERAEAPFTLGIYGEWGAGKTSFVRLIQHFLYLNGIKKKLEELGFNSPVPLEDNLIEDLMTLKALPEDDQYEQAKTLISAQKKLALDETKIRAILKIVNKEPVEFIYFSAWPFTTSDNIWRALVLEITRSLYNKANVQESTETPAPLTFAERIQKFLSADMIHFNMPAPVKDPLEAYKSILTSLDNTAYGSISKDTELQYQFNHEIALTSIVEGALKALGSISPLVRMFQGFFGVEFKTDLSNVFQKEKNVANRKIVESIDEFRQLLKKIFDERTERIPVFVFVDDLDRCLPDVALDILEAIKIFLNEIPSIFIVAADDNLIGQGLRLRYNDLFNSIDEAKMDALLAVKGQEYFEKIIQFGVKVPSKTTQETHHFISAQFPKWMPATDIIQAAVGDNPRRLKQYCNRLTYSFMVYEVKFGSVDNDEVTFLKKAVLDKMVQVFAWSQPCARKLGEMAEALEVNAFRHEMTGFEAWLSNITSGNAQVPDLPSCKDICQAIADIPPLISVFKEEPFFRSVDPVWIAGFSQFADIRPTREGILETSDATFMRIQDTKISFSAKNMMIDNLARLIDFFSWDKQSFQGEESYFKLARSGKWPEGMKLLEWIFENLKTFLEDKKDDDQNTSALADITEKLKKENPDHALLDIITKIGQLRESDPEHATLLSMRDQVIKAPKLSTILAREVLYFRKACEAGLPDIKDLVSLEFQNALSEDVKVYRKAEELYNRWDRDKRQITEDSLKLRFFAAEHFRQLRAIAKLDGMDYKWPRISKMIRENGHLLIRDLEKGPNDESFSTNPAKDLYNRDLGRFLEMRPLFKEIPETALNQYLAVSQISAKAMPLEEKQTATPVPAAQALSIDKQPFKPLTITIKKANGITSDLLRKVSVLFEGVTNEEDITINPEEIRKEIMKVNFERLPASSVMTRGLGIHATPNINAESFGNWLLIKLLGESDLRKFFDNAINSPGKIRLVFELKDDDLFPVPVELLYLEKEKTFISITQRISVLRFVKTPQGLPQRGFESPVKILVAIARPKNVPYLDYDQERDIILHTIKEAVANKLVEVYVVDNASEEKLRRAFRLFEPHIFHFIGHGVPGALVLENEKSGDFEYLNIEQLGVLLDQYRINIAFLNACDTATTRESEVSTGIAGRLVEKGIPAVIASTKAIIDQTALLFTKEFYQALLDGFSLETAMSEARKALWFDQLEWYPYILFTSTTELDNFRLKTVTKREAEPAGSGKYPSIPPGSFM